MTTHTQSSDNGDAFTWRDFFSGLAAVGGVLMAFMLFWPAPVADKLQAVNTVLMALVAVSATSVIGFYALRAYETRRARRRDLDPRGPGAG